MNTDIRVDVGFLDHWKTDTLIIKCGAEGVLALMRLWIFAAQNKPDGRLTGIETDLIERIAKWRGETGALLRVLTETRFIEQDRNGVWCLHDWERHNPYAASAEWRHERAKKANAARRAKQEPPEERNKPATSALVAHSKPAPSPAPAPAPAPSPAPPPMGKDGGSPEPESPSAPPSPQGTRLDADWKLPAAWRAWAEQERPDLDPDDEAQRFWAYYVHLPDPQGSRSDWLATWRTWIRKAYTIYG